MNLGEDMGKWPASVIERHPDGAKSLHYFESADAARLAVAELGSPDCSYEIQETA